MEPMEQETEMAKNLHDLLVQNKKASMDEVFKVLETGSEDTPFDPEISYDSNSENLPVCLAVRAQRVDILKMLIEKFHADVNFSFCISMIPVAETMDLEPATQVCKITLQDFIILACCNDFDLCMAMLELASKNPPDCFSKCSKNLLFFIIHSSVNCVDIRVVQALLQPHKQMAWLLLPTDACGRTCLHHVALRCDASSGPNAQVVRVLEELAKVRLSLNEFDDFGLTALQYACRGGCLAAVRVLIAAGADVNKFTEADSCTALHIAVAAENIALVHELLQAGAKTNTDVICNFIAEEPVNIAGDPSDVARSAGNYRLARYVSDPLRSSLGVLLDSDPAANGNTVAAIMFEPEPGEDIEGTCAICIEETKLIPLGHCHHAFCRECLAHWFNISTNGVTRPKCPHPDCNMPVSIYDIQAVLGKEKADYADQLLLQRALAEMPDFRWCPHCNSGGFFRDDCHNAECLNCGYEFCTECHQKAHPGMTCQQKTMETVGCRVFTGRWMSENTKKCPACHVPICKNGGCSHMRCSRCNYEFCWYCLGKYQGVYTFEERCPCPKRQNT